MNFYKKLCLLTLLIGIFSIFTMQAQPPELTSPSNGASCLDQNVELNWTKVFGAVKYRVEVSKFVDFVEFTVNSVVDTNTCKIYLPDNDTKYFWRIFALFSDNTESGTNKWNFATKKAAPIVITPFDNVVCGDTNVVFKWRHDGANSYRIQISEKSDFSTLFVDYANLADTVYKIRFNKFGVKYYWRVSSLFSSCPSVWSVARSYTTKDPAPTYISPVNNAKGGVIFSQIPFDINLKWKSVANATSYDLQVTKDPTFTNVEFDFPNITDTTKLVNLASYYDSTYYWRLRTNTNTCTGYWQTPNIFMTPLKKSVAILPINDSACVSLTNAFLNWTPVAGTTAYRVQVSDTVSFSRLLVDTANIFNNLINVKLNKPLTKMYWRVRAEDTRNSGLWSDKQTFITTNAAPDLLLPVNEELGTPLLTQLKWAAFDTSYKYRIQVATDKSFTNIVIFNDTILTNTYNITLPLTNTKYFWRVMAYTSSCNTDWTAPKEFTSILGAPKLISPANKSDKISIYPVFVWNKVANAISYDIELYTDSTLTKLLKFRKDIKDTVFSFAGEPLNELTPYYWRVRSVSAVGKSAWASSFKFTTGVELPVITQLISPANGSTKVPVEVALLWNKTRGADNYEIQISLVSDFTTIFSKLTLSDTTLKITGLENYTNFYWRVRASNNRGFGPWSVVFQFRTVAIAPDKKTVLLLPLDNFKDAPNGVTFTWESVPRALGYNLQISKTNDFSPANLVYDFPKVWEPSKDVFPLEYNKKYYWRVSGWNESGVAPWSDVRTFTTVDPVSVEEFVSKYDVKVYPNPTSDLLRINMNLESNSLVQIQLFTNDGKLVYSISKSDVNAGNYQETLTLTNLPSGSYQYVISVNADVINGNIRIIR